MDTKKQSVTFFSKHLHTCPACQTEFQKEELQTGRGRINAGDLTPELRRMYIPTQKYGVVNPLIYTMLVCPSCYLTGFPNDFLNVSKEKLKQIQDEEDNRRKLINKIFGKDIDFTEPRDTVEGLASYILAFASTIFLLPEQSPTARRGLFSLRAAWLADDLYKASNLEHFKELSDALYYQAYINYDLCLELQIKNKEPFDGFVWMGPDIDTNFGYDGLLYIIAILTHRHLNLYTQEEQIVKLGVIKKVLSKIFGNGKAARNKPAVLVTSSKENYAKANALLKQLAEKGLDTSVADEIEKQDEEENNEEE